jgi:hypothetical protein
MDTSIDVPNPAPGHNGPAVKAKQRNSRAVKFPIQPQEPSLRDKLSDSPPPSLPAQHGLACRWDGRHALADEHSCRNFSCASKWRPISSKLMPRWLYFKYGSLKCRRCADAVYASQTCSKRLRPILQAQRTHLFLKLKTGMWKRTCHRLKARITTAVRQELKSKRLAHHSIQTPLAITALAVLCIGVRPRMRWRSCHVSRSA